MNQISLHRKAVSHDRSGLLRRLVKTSFPMPGTGRLAKGLRMWHQILMNATLSLDEAGRLVLPNNALRLLGIKPGDLVRADVSPNRIDICPEPPPMAEEVLENGVLVMARQGIPMDAAAAVRADRDALAGRSLPR